MLGLYAAILFSPVQLEPMVQLYRGSQAGGGFGYWAVTDTFLDAARPEENFGRDPLLSGGPKKTILVRFGQIGEAMKGKRVKSAYLSLNKAFGEVPKFDSIGSVLGNWGEGPDRRGFQFPRYGQKRPDPKAKPVAPIGAATWKFRQGGRGGSTWDDAGASGLRDVKPIDSAHGSGTTDGFVIDGLGPAVQQMIDNPADNFGFAISFATNCEFFSGDTLRGPTLNIVYEDAPQDTGPDLAVGPIQDTESVKAAPTNGSTDTFTVNVKNIGASQSSGFDVVWRIRDREVKTLRVDKTLAPGASEAFTLEAPYEVDPLDHRRNPVQFVIRPLTTEANSTNNYTTFWMGGRNLLVESGHAYGLNSLGSFLGFDGAKGMVLSSIQWLNDVAFPQSKFAAFPEGSVERLNMILGPSELAAKLTLDPRADYFSHHFILSSLGLPDYSAQRMSNPPNPPVHNSLSGGGDTRDDDAMIPGVALPQDGWYSQALAGNPLPATSLLCRTDVGLLNTNLGKPVIDLAAVMPRLTLLKLMTPMGQPIAGAQVQFYPVADGKLGDVPYAQGTTTSQGTVKLAEREGTESAFGPLNNRAKDGIVLVKVTIGGASEVAWLPFWRVVDEAFRGGAATSIVELRVNLGDAGADETKNLSLNRIISDSSGATPAQLSVLVDDDPATTMELGGPQGQWVEIDLGRDRLVSEISFFLAQNDIWSSFDLMRFGTGQKIDDASPFAKEVFGDWAAMSRMEKFGTDWLIRYRGKAARMRTIRLVIPKDSKSIKVGEIRIFAANVSEPPSP